MRRRLPTVAGLALALLTACGGDGDANVTCPNGIVVYDGVDCVEVTFDADNLPPEIAGAIIVLEDEADADPSKAIGNAQAIQRLLATLPSEVCRALQSDPDGEFVKTETIAPIAAELEESVCPRLTPSE